MDIAGLIEDVLSAHDGVPLPSLEEVQETDRWARARARAWQG